MKIKLCLIFLSQIISLIFCNELSNETLNELHNLKNTIKANVHSKINQLANDGIDSEPIISKNGVNIVTNEPIDIDKNDIHNLANVIKQRLQKELKPVYGLRLIFRMKNGVGGTTIVTFFNDMKLVIKNNQMYQCSGKISDDGACSEPLQKFAPNENQDFCYLRSFAEIEGVVCLSDSPLKGQKCVLNKEEVLSINKEEYKALCGNIVNIIKYKYISDRNNRKHVEIPNENDFVKCDNEEPGICEFSSKNVIGNESKSEALLNTVNV
ncbi:unnamed protein product [Brassicogethes aeneus]|uniref:Uncharacterized protein n=1 Tax=Brassicogethes aeneus TaxID=1431903 RepID=A0A9P0BB65_BRAAE|nr:unnamed protein product [Brassicogethes aeneus]